MNLQPEQLAVAPAGMVVCGTFLALSENNFLKNPVMN